jgi:hypothetical protein
MFKLAEVRVKSIFLLLLLNSILCCSLSYSQVSIQVNQKAENFGKNVYGLGISGGAASGVGISFRNHLPSKISYQIVGGIFKSADKTWASIGGEFQFDLVRGNSTRLFFGPSTSYFHKGTGDDEYRAPFRFGIGVGGEFSLQNAINISLEGVFVYFSNGEILPMPQIAAHYYFY